MTTENTLFLECRGCYFWEDDKINSVSDVGNYRVCTTDYLPAKDGNSYFLEFTNYAARRYRTTHKITGKPLKHGKIDILLENALHIETEFTNDRGSWRNCRLEEEIHKTPQLFTLENILKTINKITIKQYEKIILVSHAPIINELNNIYKRGGFRERDILNNLKEIRCTRYDKDYKVYSFIAYNGDTFDYEANTKRITA